MVAGKVINQSITEGSPIAKGQLIKLELNTRVKKLEDILYKVRIIAIHGKQEC